MSALCALAAAATLGLTAFSPEAAQKRTCEVKGTAMWPEASPRDPDDRVKARFFGATVEQGLFERAEWHQDVPVQEGRFEAVIPTRGGTASHAVYVARAEHGDFLFAHVERVECGADLVLELREAPHLLGRAVDDRGEPLASVRVVAQQGSAELPNASMERLQRTVACDEKGRFDLPLCSDGAWHVAADAEGHAPASASVVVLPSDAIRLVLPRGGTVAGRVVDGSGGGVADVTVRALPGADRAELDYFGLGTRWAKTDADGRFVLEGTVIGPVRIAVQADPAPPAVALEVAPGQRIDDVVVTVGG
jgi:hypothetical protein